MHLDEQCERQTTCHSAGRIVGGRGHDPIVTTLSPAARRPVGNAMRPRSRSMKKVGGSGGFGVDTQHAQQIVAGYPVLSHEALDVGACFECCEHGLQTYRAASEDR